MLWSILIIRKKEVKTKAVATMPFKSFANITSTPYLAIPGQTKTVSTKNAFPNINAKSNPIIVTVGIEAGFKAYLVAILKLLNAYDLANSMYCLS